MQISFNIPDDVGADYLLAAKWKLGNPALTDNQIINKCTKKAIALIIDEHKKYLSVQSEQAALAAAQTAYEVAYKALAAKSKNNIPPTDIP